MNAWFYSAQLAARDRMDRARKQAAVEAAARLARQGEPSHGSLARARRWAAGRLHRLAEVLEPRMDGSAAEALKGRQADGRPLA